METLNKIKRRFVWVVIFTILGLAGGVGYSYATGGGYSATARLFVSTSATDAIAAAQGDIAGQARVKTYAVLATGPLVLERAAQRSHTGVSGTDLAARLTVVPIPETVILEITVTDNDRTAAAALADAVAGELTELAPQVETPINGGARAQGLLTIQPASSGIATVGRFKPKPVMLGAFLGFVTGIALAGVLPRRKTKPEPTPKREGPGPETKPNHGSVPRHAVLVNTNGHSIH